MNHQSLQAPTLLAGIILMNCISQRVRLIELIQNNLQDKGTVSVKETFTQ